MTAGPSLHIARDSTGVDIDAAERAAASFLAALGIDVEHEDLQETPARMARAYAELFSSVPLRLTTFANDEGYDELVLARSIPFRTVCEHHLLPFSGVAHVGYLPGERIVGLSKLARLVEHFAARPQVQERLTKQVAECLASRLRARGVGVVLEAEHSCMTLRGVRALGAKTVTSALLGTLRSDPASRAEFFALAGAPRLELAHRRVTPERITIMTDQLADLSSRGVSIWLDDLSRDRLTSGSLASLVARDHVVGVTTNPTIFAKAISGGDEAYAGQLHDLWARGTCVHEALRDLTTHDVRWACDVLRPAYDASDGVDGRASIEVDPRLAYDTEATIAEARALWWRVDRPNLFIKIAAAREGLPAITACLAEGISINVTLIFSLTRYDEVIDAFLEGLERARQAGRDLAPIVSVASFFVSRVDTEIDARLDKTGTAAAAALRGRAAIANARLAYQRYERMLASPRWAALAAAGARPQRPLWASTSVKDPAYPDTMYVTKLVAPGVVNTMPEATLRAVADHGEVPADSMRAHYSDARQVLTELAAVGVDYDDVTAGLEHRGLELFDASWRELSDQLAAKLRNPCHS
jgi:transaldolase